MPNGQRIGITGDNGFVNFTPEIPFPGRNSKRSKGRGAISAVKYLTDWDHSEAEKWLVDVFGDQEAAREVARNFREQIPVDRDEPARIRRANRAAETILDLETPDASRWPEASQTLTGTFRFRGDAVAMLRENQWIAANRHGHFVFQKVLASGKEFVPAGNLIVDPKHPTVILADTGEGLNIHPGDDNLILCATPMDALAIKSSTKHHGATVVVIGNNPTEITLATLRHLMDISRGMKVLADNLTIAGQRLAIWLTLHFPNLGNLTLPRGCSHWLDAHNPPPEPDPARPDPARPDPAQPGSEQPVVEPKNQGPEKIQE